MPEISVIVPMYNVEEFIEGCLESVAAQTFKDFECVCIDDGSPDKSAQIAERFAQKDARFRVIHQKNGGLSDARNTGFQNTSAPYVFFLDSDDYIHPKTLEALYDTMKKNNAQLVNCGIKNTSNKYNEKLEDIDISHCKKEIIKNPLKAFCTRRDIKTAVCSRLYPRESIKGIPFIKGICFEDVPFTTQLFDKTKELINIQQPLYYYYKNPTSIMRSNFTTQKIDSYDIIIRHLYDYFMKSNPEKLPYIQKHLFNQRIKMLLNQCVRKQKDKDKQALLFEHAQSVIKSLYDEKLISYKGLKIKHKIALWLILNRSAAACNKWCRLI